MKTAFFITTLLCSATLWISCASDPPARKPLKQVVCKYWLQQCHFKARHHCASGYTVSRSTRVDKVGGPNGSYKEFNMLFYCN